jgi:hypothetical protein
MEEDSMKILFILITSLFALTAQAQTVFEHFTVEDQWLPLVAPDGTLVPNIIVPGEFECTGGGEPVAPIGCDGGTGIHIRDAQGVSCLTEPATLDWRLQGMAWWNLAANWDSLNTGPVSGIWRIVPRNPGDPGDCIDMALIMDPENYWDGVYTYWEGTYTGKRELIPDPEAPLDVKWVSTLKFVGQGMGDLAGQKMMAVETITTYYPSPAPGEFFGISDPEGILEVTIKTKY